MMNSSTLGTLLNTSADNYDYNVTDYSSSNFSYFTNDTEYYNTDLDNTTVLDIGIVISHSTTDTPHNVDSRTRTVYQESHPEWNEALAQWGCVFPLHYYIYGIAFLLDIVILLISTLTATETGRKSMVLLNALLLMCGLCRGVPLVIDPYGSMKVLPRVFYGVLNASVKPCLTSAFCLIIWTFMNIAQVKIGICGIPRDKIAYWLILSHFLITMTIHLLITAFPDIRLLLVVSEIIFIVWGLSLSAIFVSKTFRISQFTSEAKRTYKEISDYNLNKKEFGNARPKRVKRPKMKVNRSESYSALEDSSNNSDSTEDESIQKGKIELSPSIEVLMQNETLTVLKRNHPGSEFQKLDVGSHIQEVGSERESESDTGSVFTADDFPHVCDRPVNCHLVNSDSDLEKRIHHNDPESVVEVQIVPRDSVFELGYLGDSEFGSPCKRKQNDGRSSDARNSSLHHNQNGTGVPILPRDTSLYISYRRLRIGRSLHKLVKLSHVTVTSLFLLCILYLYSMFGVYGILSKHKNVQPWPWLAFHTCLRSAELLMVSTMTYSAVCLNKNRRKHTKRRHGTKPTHSDTVNTQQSKEKTPREAFYQ